VRYARSGGNRVAAVPSGGPSVVTPAHMASALGSWTGCAAVPQRIVGRSGRRLSRSSPGQQLENGGSTGVEPLTGAPAWEDVHGNQVALLSAARVSVRRIWTCATCHAVGIASSGLRRLSGALSDVSQSTRRAWLWDACVDCQHAAPPGVAGSLSHSAWGFIAASASAHPGIKSNPAGLGSP